MDPATLIVAATGALTGVGGLILSRQARADTVRAQIAASRVEQDRIRLAETEQALGAYRGLVETLQADAVATRERLDWERREREADRAAHERTLAAAADRETQCHEALRDLTETVATLRAVVLDEVAAEAARVVAASVEEDCAVPRAGAVEELTGRLAGRKIDDGADEGADGSL